jgi:hypothetical protein
MATFQEKLENATLQVQKKIFDNNIKILGQEIKMLRLKVTYSQYQDEDTIESISDGLIDIIIDLPVDIPLNRYRGQSTGTEKESVFLFDIIPIFIYFQWTPKDDQNISNGNIEQGDYLVYVIKDGSINIPILFRVSEMLGAMRKNLVYKKARIAPYNGQVTPEIQNKITAYLASLT